eukprot:8464708-Pyramimonas_sp.AAC.1
MSGNYWNRFGDSRHVRRSNPELGTLSTAELGPRTYSCCSSHPERCCGFMLLTRAVADCRA